MKMTLHHFEVRSTTELDSWVERQILALGEQRQIDEAVVRLAQHHDASPAFRVHIHLVTPGPDLVAEACDHTLEAAFAKVMRELNDGISSRERKRQQRLKSKEAAPAGRSRAAAAMAGHN